MEGGSFDEGKAVRPEREGSKGFAKVGEDQHEAAPVAELPHGSRAPASKQARQKALPVNCSVRRPRVGTADIVTFRNREKNIYY